MEGVTLGTSTLAFLLCHILLLDMKGNHFDSAKLHAQASTPAGNRCTGKEEEGESDTRIVCVSLPINWLLYSISKL